MLLRRLGIVERLLAICADVLVRLYHIFVQYEALIAEINPLVILETGYQGGLLAIDSVIEIDNSALNRVKLSLPEMIERIENPLERKGREIGVTYVDLGGDIGIISSGAGLGMATMDIIGERLRPANFLETGGGITEELLYKCMELVMMKADLRAIFINVYGGINPIHEGARGVVRYIKEHNVTIPIVAKALGNHQEETWEILRSGGVHVVTEAPTEIAVERLFELVGAQ
jgi:succinyl-CoA synthetase beta subunit